MGDKASFKAELRNKKYIDNYVEKWLKLETLDKPYVECEICGYTSNASIHQHLLMPEELDSDSNRILHLCANCDYEFRALIDKYQFKMAFQRIPQIYEEAFEELKDKKKRYREMHQSMDRIEI